MRSAIERAESDGKLSSGDAAAAVKFLGGSNQLSVSQYVQGLRGAAVSETEGFQAADRVMKAIGMADFHPDQTTAEIYEDQFWGLFDVT